MPAKGSPMPEIRASFVALVVHHRASVTQACAKFGISRKTGYRWLQRDKQAPGKPIPDHSRRPLHAPARTPHEIEQRVMEVHAKWGWGPRKVRKILLDQGLSVPSINTVQAIIKRLSPQPAPPQSQAPVLHFQRPTPNDLWQMDFKGPIEISRTPMYPLSVIDDHSRFLLCLDLMATRHHAALWDRLWLCFGEYGLPNDFLCDNEFSTRYQTPRTLSWFDSQLLRLGIRPVHGRAFHPQTQGKIERIHGTYERELLPRARKDSPQNFIQDADRYRYDYNHLRPHQALDDQAPVTRWAPSTRKRPPLLPEPTYPPEAIMRKVASVGEVRWKGFKISTGRGLVGQYVGLIDLDEGLAIYYCNHRIRLVDKHSMTKGPLL